MAYVNRRPAAVSQRALHLFARFTVMWPGRNDPCPCGSGKKYKKCHGAADREAAASPAIARATALKARDAELADLLMRFARKRYGAQWMRNLMESAAVDRAGAMSEADLPILVPWLLHFRANASGVTLADEWSRDTRGRITPGDALILAAYRDAWMSIWEVTEVEPGIGSQLTDLLTRETRFVHDVSSSTTLQPFDAVLAIILTSDGVSFFGGAHGQPLPPRFAERAVRAARRMCRVRTRPVAPEKLRDPQRQFELVALWSAVVDNMLDQPPPVMHNTDGDPLQLTSDDFSLLAPRDAIARALAQLPGVQEPETEAGNMVFTVTKAGNPMNRAWDNTVIGRIVLAATRLTVETNSARRADSLRAAIETRLHALVRFRLRKEENTAHLMAAAREGRATRSSRPRERLEQLEPEMLAEIRAFRERHMRAWINDSIPALGGLTPREAARSPRVRARLEMLLKEFEQNEAQQPEEQRIGLRWLWEELGFS